MRPAIVAEARTWLGTPFLWQASVKGRGCDCKGLVTGVARALDLPGADSLHARMAAYHNVDTRVLIEGLRANMDKVDQAEPGDVLLLKMRGQPVHLGILGYEEIIHTYGAGPKQVIAMPAGVVLRRWPLDSAWRFRAWA